MVRIIAPLSDRVVADGDVYQENSLNKIKVDDGGHRAEISVKTLLADDLSVFLIGFKCPGEINLNFELTDGQRAIGFIQSGSVKLELAGKASPKTANQNTFYNISSDQHLPIGMHIRGEVNICLVCLKQHIAAKLLTNDEATRWPAASSAPTSPAMASIINAIIRHAGEGPFQRIMMIAKTLELLFMSLAQLSNATSDPDRPPIRSADREKLEAARSIIARDLQSPCSLVELAHKVGLNDFKLKKGFKELYGTTVFGYLTYLRMEKAKRMLASAQYSISEVAHEVGYKNGHHFTVAFKKRFGHVPSKMQTSSTI